MKGKGKENKKNAERPTPNAELRTVHYTYMPGEVASELCGTGADICTHTNHAENVTCIDCLRLLIKDKEGEIKALHDELTAKEHRNTMLCKELLIVNEQLSARNRELANMRLAAHDAASAVLHATEVSTR